MLAKRIIPCLDVHAGRVVKGVKFKELRDAGDPVACAKAYDEQGADELVFLDITASSDEREIMHQVVEATASQCFMPLTVGGGLRNLENIRQMLHSGADKVSLNTAAINDPDLILKSAVKFGNQCIVLAIDAEVQRYATERLAGESAAAVVLDVHTGEIIALAAVAARAGGVYDTHMRSESTAGVGVTGAVREVIRIAESAGVPAHIAHLKALGSDAWGSSREIIELVDAARERGLAITADQYPYRASGTRFSSALVPQWARADSPAAMFLRFDDPDLAQRLREDMTVNLGLRGGADAMLGTAPGREGKGTTRAEMAAAHVR